MNRAPLISIKPTFQLWVRFFQILPLTLFLQVWTTGFFGGIAYFCLHALQAKGQFTYIPLEWVFIPPPILVFYLTQIHGMHIEYQQSKNTTYSFFEDELIVRKEYWVIEENSIPYHQIVELTLSKGIFQRGSNLGSIKVTTLSTGERNSTVTLNNISNPDDVYQKVKALIKKNNALTK
jgi:membrane protein YdbS with pleckstrin-like domain